jgi:subtilase family serine protease
LPTASAWQALPNYSATPLYAFTGSTYIYTPADLRTLYGFNQIPYYGQGQTIAIVDAYDDPNLYPDLMRFDQTFGLPGQSWWDIGNYLVKANQYGGSWLPAPNAGWAGEESLDVEWAHAMAPYARIVLIEANSASFSDLLSAVNLARYVQGVSVVSMSWGGSEFASEAAYDGFFTTPAGHNNVTFVASSGDHGAWVGPEWPSVSPNVLAVGGTTLFPNWYETAWAGSGGGFSRYEREPAYQYYYGIQVSGVRTTPDVSYNADPNTGYFVFDTYAPGGGGWYDFGGTSAGAPQWAALLAVTDSYRAAYGLGSIGNAQYELYLLGAGYFRDIWGGSNGYNAGPGYDLATGRGAPWANWIIPALTFAGFYNYGGSFSVTSNYARYSYWGTPDFDPGNASPIHAPGTTADAQSMEQAPFGQTTLSLDHADPFSSPSLLAAPVGGGLMQSPAPTSHFDVGGGTSTATLSDDIVWLTLRRPEE